MKVSIHEWQPARSLRLAYHAAHKDNMDVERYVRAGMPCQMIGQPPYVSGFRHIGGQPHSSSISRKELQQSAKLHTGQHDTNSKAACTLKHKRRHHKGKATQRPGHPTRVGRSTRESTTAEVASLVLLSTTSMYFVNSLALSLVSVNAQH